MYLDFYQLREKPFPLSSGLKFLFLSPSHKEALDLLAYTVSQRKGFMAVLGEFGLGKTTLIQAFLKEASRGNVKVIPLLNSNISFEELLRFLSRELGLSGEAEGPPGLLNQLLQGLSKAYQAGINVVLLIDEAHNMPEETLESLRMVSNPGFSSDPPLQIVFFGQPEFWETLGHYDLRQLKQRIGVRINLLPLNPVESRRYIRFRIERAGGRVKDIFTRGALDRIIQQAAGCPGKINILSNNVLIRGYAQPQKPISGKIVKEVIHGSQGAKRTNNFPWALSSVGLFLILLEWIALNRFPDFSPISKNHFRLSLINQAQSGRIVTGKVIEERSVPSVPWTNLPKENKSKRPSLPPASKGSVREEDLPTPLFSSETEIVKPPPRSEEKPPVIRKNPEALEPGSNNGGDLPPVLKKPSPGEPF